MQVALGVAHDADLQRDVRVQRRAAAGHELRRPAADVDDRERPRRGRRAAGRGAQERQPRLLVARQHARVQPVARPHLARELAPLAASRTALVMIATDASQPSAAIAEAYSSIVPCTRSIAAAASRGCARARRRAG